MLDLILQTCVNAVAAGAYAALFAVGLVLIFGIMKVCNFAQGELFMGGAYTVWFVYNQHKLPYIVGVLAGVVVAILLGLLMELALFRQKRHDMMAGLLLSVGALFVLQTVAIYLFGLGLMKSVEPPISGTWQVFGLKGVSVTFQRLIIIGATGGLLILFGMFLKWTKLGNALRACANDYEAAALQGISINKMALIAMAMSAGMAGIAGGLMSPLLPISPFMGGNAIIMAFIIIIVGGTGSLSGAVLAAFLYAFFITFATTFIDGETARILGLAFVLLALVIKPTGLLIRYERI